MLNITKRSRALNFLKFISNSLYYNIGIINGYWYSYGHWGAYRFDVRPDYMSDNRFPGIRSTSKKISTKKLVSLLTEDFLNQHSTNRLFTFTSLDRK